MANNPIWPAQPIWNAADVPLGNNTGNLPNLSGTLSQWFQPIQMEQITKSVVNFQVTETTTPVNFQGLVQQFSSRQLLMKPEGQRGWDWRSIFCWPSVSLNPDDVVVWQGKQFRVMAVFDWTQYGFKEYHVQSDYTGSGPA